MFYDTSAFRRPLEGTRDDRFHAVVVLLPNEGKRLIAKGTQQIPEIQRVLRDGWLIVSRGITPSYLLEEITGEAGPKGNYTAGIITQGRLSGVHPDDQVGPWVLRDGKLVEVTAPEALGQMEAKDVSIKGANAVDPEGNIGVMAGDGAGGTVGGIWGTLTARGCHWISPVSLERLIPSVIDAHFASGNHLWDLTMGSAAGLMPVVTAKAVTEIQALEILTGVTAVHIASGGVAGSEGAVVLALEGDEKTVTEAFELCESVKGEPQIPDPRIVDAVRVPENAPKR
ncbi:MAG TPA: hypothetical protein QGF95_07925 [Candidatus Latescibacteria bacterium]|jgi:hypothetical protein|nr:hypothetical protein [Gemmatimonadaceae bacterium]HJP30467.1 hypothetical protein [Candidatus Latescibacterota bacterium]